MRSIWHSMPLRSFALLLAAVFLTFVPIGFLTDVYSMGANSPGSTGSREIARFRREGCAFGNQARARESPVVTLSSSAVVTA